MGLRCSLFGHAYGDLVTERDRERRGDEEVVTVRELRTCKRCGVEKVLSENTEVRHLDSAPTDPDPGSPVDREPATDVTEDRSAPEETEEEVAVTELVDVAETDQSVPAGTAESPDGTAEAESDSVTESGDTDEEVDSKPAAPEAEEAIETEEPAADDEGGIIMDEGPEDQDESVTGATETAETPAEAEPERNTPSEADPERSVPSDADREENRPTDEEPTVDTTDEKSDGVILGEESDADVPASEGSDTAEEPEETPSGIDAVDDIDEIQSDAAEPADETAATAEPESMFGAGGDTEPGSDHPGADVSAREERDASPSETTDDWKEPLETDRDSTAGNWDDPAYQFQPEPEESKKPETGPQRGPAGITSDGPLETDSASDTVPGALVCPDCGYTETAQSSLRAGDICPECHRGYLAGRQ